MKKLISLLLVLAFLIVFSDPVLTVGTASAAAPGEESAVEENETASHSCVLDFFRSIIARITSLWQRFTSLFKWNREKIRNTMNQNAIHMLKSATDTIGDSFIITTEDGKVIVVDGGHYSDTDYFIKYLLALVVFIIFHETAYRRLVPFPSP